MYGDNPHAFNSGNVESGYSYQMNFEEIKEDGQFQIVEMGKTLNNISSQAFAENNTSNV